MTILKSILTIQSVIYSLLLKIVWLKFSSWNLNISISHFWLFFIVKNEYLSSENRTRWLVRV